jgi:hypothetical protein
MGHQQDRVNGRLPAVQALPLLFKDGLASICERLCVLRTTK